MSKYQEIVSQFFPKPVMEEGAYGLVAWSGAEVKHVEEEGKEVKLFEIDRVPGHVATRESEEPCSCGKIESV